ncbi:MAG: hypothetical protein E7Z80_06020 [Methanobrevibacter thaueri]|nr:hypothetical protein [Methanobrevibacter thaueri]
MFFSYSVWISHVGFSSNQDSYSMKQDNRYYKEKSKCGSNQLTDDDILKYVKKSVWWDDDHGGSTKDVKFGKIYHGKKGLCLVPAFDKKTGKFLGAIWVGCDDGIGGFFRIH